MQAVRQSPINLRPLLGIKPLPSTKGAVTWRPAYLTMYQADAGGRVRRQGDQLPRVVDASTSRRSSSEYSWANHFDFASRGGRYSKDESIIVWTALIGQAFLDGFEALGDQRYLDVAESVCRWILALPQGAHGLRDVPQLPRARAELDSQRQHARRRAAGPHVAHTQEIRNTSTWRPQAMQYSCTRQRPDGLLVVWRGAEVPLD